MTLDDRPVAARIGLVLLATDHTSERDFARIVPADRSASMCNRIAYDNPTTPETLRAMEPRLAEGAALILPGEPLDAICFSCTAASVGDRRRGGAGGAQRGKPGVPVRHAADRPLEGRSRRLASARISILTPYLDETAAPVADYFAGHGFEVDRLTSLGLDDDRAMARVATRSIVEAAARGAATTSRKRSSSPARRCARPRSRRPSRR